MQQPDENDNDLDALFGARESINVPGEEEDAGALDVFASGGTAELPALELGSPTDPPDPEATLAPEVAPSLGASADMSGLPRELAEHSRYHVLRQLGQGGMGSVYQAEHRVMNRLVALKVILPQFTSSPAAAERFRREVRTAAQLHHPNIVSAFDAEQAGGLHFLVMEYVEGTNLGEYLRAKGPLPVREVCDYVRQAAIGLQYAHRRGMVHRDLKPDNLMRTDEGQVKILDFGLARLRESRAAEEPVVAPSSSADTVQLTLAGTLMGTPDYMAPEQAHDSSGVDIRADIYSLGCTLYQLLTGAVPYPGMNVLDKVMRHAEDPVPAVSAKRPDAPAGLDAVVAKMMAKKPEERYQTPAEVAEALRPFVEAPAVVKAESPAAPKPPLVVISRRGWWLLGVLAALYVLYFLYRNLNWTLGGVAVP